MSTQEHSIRLAGPWELVHASVCTTIKLPCSRDAVSQLAGASAIVSLSRRFNTPTNLTVGDRVFVEVPTCFGEVESVTLDGAPLATSGEDPHRYEMTGRLSGFHTLQINRCRGMAENLTAAALVIVPMGAVQ